MKTLVRLLAALLALMASMASLSNAQSDLCKQDQPCPGVVYGIIQGQNDKAKVEICGSVEKWEPQPASNTFAYEFKDFCGDAITVVTDKGHPTVDAKYWVIGIVGYDAANRQWQVTELNRVELTPPIEPKKKPGYLRLLSDWKFDLLLGAIVLVLILILLVLLRGRQQRATAIVDIDGLLTGRTDITTKIETKEPIKKALDDGTFKIMPGRFVVEGGVDIPEIRLFKTGGMSDDRLEYTFGRLKSNSMTHIHLNDQTVSSNQARLKVKGGKYILINVPDPDDPDRNATMLNGKVMQAGEAATLEDGDIIKMGYVTLVFRAA